MGQTIIPTNQYKKYAQSITPFIQSQKTKNYSTVIFFFLVLSVFGWYAIRPTIQTILYLQREIKDKTDVDRKMDQKIYALIEANSAYETNLKSFTLLNEAIPTTPEAIDLVSQMNTIAKNADVTLTTLQALGLPLSTQSAILSQTKADAKGAAPVQKSKNGEITFPINFSVEGKYLNVVSFLKDLVSLRRIITIQSMNFIPVKPSVVEATDSSKLGNIKVTLTCFSYYETE